MTFRDIEQKLAELFASPDNSLRQIDRPAFGAPLLGCAAGDDPLFDFFKRDIGGPYQLPGQWLERKFGRAFAPEKIRVLSYVAPQTDETRREMHDQSNCPTLAWALNRCFGEKFNRGAARALAEWLNERGVPAIAPMAEPDFSWGQSPKYGWASNWSERHAAYACGLGTFGLCDGLISTLGKAVRYGSVIAEIELPVTPRPYERFNQYCLANEGCTACQRRCPAGAISPSGHDKQKCEAYQDVHVVPIFRRNSDFEGPYGCGLCQTGVPCESCPPRR